MSTPDHSRRYLSVTQAAGRLSIGRRSVLSLIATGQLPAINAAVRPDGQARWRITVEALAAFERSRASVAAV